MLNSGGEFLQPGEILHHRFSSGCTLQAPPSLYCCHTKGEKKGGRAEFWLAWPLGTAHLAVCLFKMRYWLPAHTTVKGNVWRVLPSCWALKCGLKEWARKGCRKIFSEQRCCLMRFCGDWWWITWEEMWRKDKQINERYKIFVRDIP